MESRPVSATYQVVAREPAASKEERIRRLGHAMGLWDKDFDYARTCRQVFRNFDLQGKTVLEIGGKGIFCLWAALGGAQEAIGLDHLSRDTEEDHAAFHAMTEEFALPQARIAHGKVQEYNGPESVFDLVVSVSSINFLDEKSCIRLRESPLAVMAYEKIFRRVARMTRLGGKLVILDAARHNFFGDLAFRNPASPYVEWFKHQQPEYWAGLLENCGFGRASIRWAGGRFLRDLHIPYIPKSLAYFGQSIFRLEMTRVR
jgi:SAM-dependent methyltransferase